MYVKTNIFHLVSFSTLLCRPGTCRSIFCDQCKTNLTKTYVLLNYSTVLAARLANSGKWFASDVIHRSKEYAGSVAWRIFDTS